MAGYTIGSSKGKQIANGMKAGSTYKASDGSTWKKNNDGSVSVTTKNGGYTANAYQSSGGSSGGGSKSSNSNSNGNSSGSNYNVDTIKRQIQANSEAWHYANDQEKQRLANENQQLGKQIGASYNGVTGEWNYGGSVLNANPNKSKNLLSSPNATYYDADGNKYNGYVYNGVTYKDAAGTQRIGTGSYVNPANGKWYQLGDDGKGVEVDAPLFSQYEDNIYGTLLEEEYPQYPTFETEEIDNYKEEARTLTDLLKNWTPSQLMTDEEAMARAYAQLGNSYEANATNTIDQYNKNAIARGMFGQIPVEALKQTALANNELDKSSAVNALAQTIKSNDYTQKRQQDQDYLNLQGTIYNMNNDQYSKEYAEQQDKKSEYLNLLEASIAEEQNQYTKMMNKLSTLGYADAEVAKALNIPVGTLSSDSRTLQAKQEYETQLAEKKQQLNMELASYKNGLSKNLASYKSGLSGGSGSKSSTKNNLSYEDAMNLAIKSYKSTGKTPTQSELESLALSYMSSANGTTPYLSGDVKTGDLKQGNDLAYSREALQSALTGTPLLPYKN